MDTYPSKSYFNYNLTPCIGKTSKMMNMYITDVFQKNDVTITRQLWIVLKILLEDSNGIVQNKLAFITERNIASLTRLINVMEKKNLVTRITSKNDFRKNLIYITKTGKALFLKAQPIFQKSILAIQTNVSGNEMEVFMQVMTMTKIQHNLKNQLI